MTTIRQEINVIDTLLQAGSGASATSDAIIRLDIARYSDATFYFEVVARSSVSLEFTVTLNGATDGTLATCTVPLLTTAYTRIRSTAFAPTTVAQDCTVIISAAVGATKDLLTARVVIIQTSTLGTQTQIEVGNHETGKTNTVAAALNFPKYWTYRAANWSAGALFYAECTYKMSSTKVSGTITLQQDDGSFGGWAGIITIVNAGSAATATRSRSIAFVPTDGRHYRIATLNSSSKSTLAIYNAKIIVDQGSTWSQVGNGLTISGITAPALAAMSSTRVAFIDIALDSLRAYDFDDSNWALVGSGFSLTSGVVVALAAMSSTRVAWIDYDLASLRAYDFNGSTWSLVGSGLTITGNGRPALAALSSTRVALIGTDLDSLRTYDFDGSNWALVGSGLTVSASGVPSLAALTATRVAYIDGGLALRTYDFDGTNWAQVGNGLTIAGITAPRIAVLSSFRVALCDDTTDRLTAYEFNGTDWSRVDLPMPIAGATPSGMALAGLTATRVAYIDESTESLRAYDRAGTRPTGFEPQYLLMNTQETGTGIKSYYTLWDQAEWAGLTTAFQFSHDATNAADSSKLIDRDNGDADVTGATVTGANQQISAAFAMPATGHQVDVNVTNSTGNVTATRILVAASGRSLPAMPAARRTLHLIGR